MEEQERLRWQNSMKEEITRRVTAECLNQDLQRMLWKMTTWAETYARRINSDYKAADHPPLALDGPLLSDIRQAQELIARAKTHSSNE